MNWKKSLLLFVLIISGLFLFFAFTSPAEASTHTSCFADCMNDIDNAPLCNAECSANTCWSDNSCPQGHSCEGGNCVDTTPFDPEAEGEGLVPCGGENQRSCTLDDFFTMIKRILEFAIFRVAPILVALMIAIGGIWMLVTSGNPQKMGMAKDLIKYAFIGFLIILLSFVILYTILTLIGVDQDTGIMEWF